MVRKFALLIKISVFVILGAIIFSVRSLFTYTKTANLEDSFYSIVISGNTLTILSNDFTFFFDTLLLSLIFYVGVAVILLHLWSSFLLSDFISKMTPTTVNTIRVIGRLIIIPFSVIAYLNGFETFQDTLLGAAALFGTAIGFASTNIISNFLSGLYLMLMRPFAIGDYILLLNKKTEGVVKEITINYTKIELPSGNTILYTNNSLLNQAIVNTGFDKNGSRLYRYGQTWGLPVAESHNLAVNAIHNTIKEYENVVEEPITWFILSRDKFERMYQINLVVKKASTLLSLTSDFLSSLSKNYEGLKSNISS